MTVLRTSITWFVTEEAARDVEDIRATHGDGYEADVNELRDMLCGYFSAEIGCHGKLGRSISPLGAVGNGKVLKVRWMTPGCGKSGGLRLAFVVYCDSRKVVLCRGFMRNEEPGDGEFEAAADLAGAYEVENED